MQEVTRQLGPLTERVGTLGNNIERLYNSNGGPPGFLQTARSEDNGRFDMIFNILDEHKADIQPIKEFMRDHEHREKDRDTRFKRYIAVWSLGAAIFMALLALWDHKDAILHSLADPPITHSQLMPQTSTIPTTR